jgi:hypothetical protein
MVLHGRFSVLLFPDRSTKRRDANSDGSLLHLAMCITTQLEEHLESKIGEEDLGGLIFCWMDSPPPSRVSSKGGGMSCGRKRSDSRRFIQRHLMRADRDISSDGCK